MLEMEAGELSMVGLESADPGLPFYSPDHFLQLRYKSPPAADILPAKQLCATTVRLPRDISEDLLEAVSTRDVERGQKEKTFTTTDAQCFRPQLQDDRLTAKQMCADHYRRAADLLEDAGKIGSREQPDKLHCVTEPLIENGEGTLLSQKNDLGRQEENNNGARVHLNQEHDIFSVITSSLSHLNLMQQQQQQPGMNSSNPELTAVVHPTLNEVAQRRPITRHMPLNFPQNLPLYSGWDSASQQQQQQQQQWNQQEQYGLNQLLLSRAGQIMPSLNGDLAAAISKLQLPGSRPVQQAALGPKTSPDMWLTEELLNGSNAVNLQQSQSGRFDAQKFSVMNPDFLNILHSSENMKRDGSLLTSLSLDQIVPNIISPIQSSGVPLGLPIDHYSRKVFVGGLPPDIAEDEITQSFRKFGPLVVDWPHKAESKSYFPPKGYCFLLFQDEMSVQALISSCVKDDGKLYWSVCSPTIKDKPVQIRPWNLGDSDFVMDGSQPLDPRKTIFVGGVPRPLRAVELAIVMNRLYGGVCYAGIDTDPELKYPKGAGRVAFSNQQSYIAAISARFVQLQHADIDKRVEVKPYVLDDQLCDECQGIRCGGKFAPYFCANVACLQYYCEHCWSQIHSRPGREFHKPLVKEGADRSRTVPYRWC